MAELRMVPAVYQFQGGAARQTVQRLFEDCTIDAILTAVDGDSRGGYRSEIRGIGWVGRKKRDHLGSGDTLAKIRSSSLAGAGGKTR